VAAKATDSPGPLQRKQGEGKPEQRAGRAQAAKAARTAPQTGRYTKPVPKSVRRSAPWYGPVVLLLLVGGVAMVVLNYLTVLPGSVSVWYLFAGIAALFTGFLMATRYR
jgi:fatty acid desaturase